MNKVILIGNLTRDPEMASTASNIPLCKFAIAVNRNFKNDSGEKEADFFNVVAWRGLGENCGKYLNKGSKVAVFGQIRTGTYEKDGVKHYRTEIEADDVEFLPSGPRMNDGSVGGTYSGAPVGAGVKKPAAELKPVEDNELPF